MTIEDAAQPPGAMDDHAGLPDAKPAAGGHAFEGAPEFAQALRDAMAHAVERGTRRLCWCDEDFASWPVGEAAWVDQLTRWAHLPGRELVMIARDWAVVERRHPRFVQWRRDWAHVVQCLVPDEARLAALPTIWIDTDEQALRVFDAEHLRGRIGFDRVDRQRAREDFDAISQRAGPGFAAATLGL
ncbi:MAG TPA: hypothetical protein VES00_13960 [Burkholderiaceae bacterium]|jgi:hypothetical protein|nr:hypothetical protein [Burkholderiaceae bacterium]